MVKIPSRPLSIIVQKVGILKLFPNSHITVNKGVLTWKHTMKPTALSDDYKIKLVYKQGGTPNVYVLKPKLKIHPNCTTLPHVYNKDWQWLCLYYKKAREWSNEMSISDTIIPWTSEWLYHYEFWLATGKWNGRGIHGKKKPFKKT